MQEIGTAVISNLTTSGYTAQRMEILLSLKDVVKTYGEHQVQALRSVSLDIEKGQFLCLMGQSGCGKSTLLNIVAGLDTATSGSVQFEGRDLTRLSDEEITQLRGRKIGFIFQFFNLLSTLTVEENVTLPLELNNLLARGERKKRVSEMLAQVGMQDRLAFYPAQLSGGEMQRVAIARALIHQPSLLVADEPTGNLDSENGLKVLELLKQIQKDLGQTIVMATHSSEAAAYSDRIVRMKDGMCV